MPGSFADAAKADWIHSSWVADHPSVSIAKNRTGPRDIDVPLSYQPHKARFRSIAWTPHSAARGAA